MQPIDKLIQLLDLPDSDYWSDDACEQARNIIDGSSELIFSHLLKEWKDWSPNRQEHLAYILGSGTSKNEKQLIEQMLNAPDADVVYRAKEAMDEIVQNLKRVIGSQP